MLLVVIHEARITCFPASYPNMTRSRPERQSLKLHSLRFCVRGPTTFTYRFLGKRFEKREISFLNQKGLMIQKYKKNNDTGRI